MTRTSMAALGLAAAVALLLPACASKKYVNGEMEKSAGTIQSVENSVEENQRRIKEIDGEVEGLEGRTSGVEKTSREALDKGNQAYSAAQEAQKIARGKLVMEVSLSGDVTQFSVDQADLPEDGIKELDGLAKKVLDMNKRVYLEIQGHTDSSGPEAWNEMLGLKRAESVRRYLNERGIPLFAMSVISFGESNPEADNSTRDGRAQNRRVVIRVLE